MKKFAKIMGYLLLFSLIGSITTVVALTVVDDYIFSLNQTSAIESNASNIINEAHSIRAKTVIDLDDNIENLQFSYNNKYFAYLKNNNVFIKNVKDGSDYSIIDEEQDICYFNLLYDKNLLIYITAEKRSGNVTRLVINTYDIDSKRKVEYNKFNITNFSRVKDMNMSPIINIIYINIETKTLTSTNNTIYQIDLFNSLYVVRSGKIYDRMIMLQTLNKVYYEDQNSNIYSSKGTLNIFKNKVELIGIDTDDNIYFLQKDDTRAIVYKVKNDKIVDTIELSDSDIVKTYTNNIGTYIVYPTYVINVAAKDPYERIARLTSYVEFLAIKDNTIYLKTKDNKMIVTSTLKSEEADSTGELTNYTDGYTTTNDNNNNVTTNNTTNNNTTNTETNTPKEDTSSDKKPDEEANKPDDTEKENDNNTSGNDENNSGQS